MAKLVPVPRSPIEHSGTAASCISQKVKNAELVVRIAHGQGMVEVECSLGLVYAHRVRTAAWAYAHRPWLAEVESAHDASYVTVARGSKKSIEDFAHGSKSSGADGAWCKSGKLLPRLHSRIVRSNSSW